MKQFISQDAMHLQLPIADKVNMFEWWYFDAHLDNGDHVVVMYSVCDTRLSPRKPSVRLNIYEPNGKEIDEITVYEDNQLSVSYDKCDTVLGDNFCRDCGGYYEILATVGNYSVHLNFHPTKPHWSRPATSTIMGWTVAVPDGTVDGTITKYGEVLQVSGTGYHDHNWGYKPMGALFKNWYWGKVHTPDYTIDYGVMIPRMLSRPVTALLVVDNSGAVLVPTTLSALRVKTKFNNIMHEPTLGLDIPQQLIMTAKQKGYSIHLEVNMDRLVMREQSAIADGESAYRYVAHEKLTVTRKGVTKSYTTSSLHEIVYLLKKK